MYLNGYGFVRLVRLSLLGFLIPVGGRRYFDFTDAKYADMTPIFQLAKEFMKAREPRKE
jgi:hypothetical protein